MKKYLKGKRAFKCWGGGENPDKNNKKNETMSVTLKENHYLLAKSAESMSHDYETFLKVRKLASL